MQVEDERTDTVAAPGVLRLEAQLLLVFGDFDQPQIAPPAVSSVVDDSRPIPWPLANRSCSA